MENKGIWGEWLLHDESGMPAAVGKWVEVATLPPFGTLRHGANQATGFAGLDIVNSWHWTAWHRLKLPHLHIYIVRAWNVRQLIRGALGTAQIDACRVEEA